MMGDFVSLMLAAGVPVGVFGVIALILNVVLFKKYVTRLENDLEKKTEAETKRLEKAIEDKASRARVVELERRMTDVEEVGLNKVWRDSLTVTLSGLGQKLDNITETMGALKQLPAQIGKLEDKLDRHIENDK